MPGIPPTVPPHDTGYADALAVIEKEARAYLADAMREPTESYPPIFATYVEQGVPSASAGVRVDTALTAIAFAIMAERNSPPLAHLNTIAQVTG